MRLAPGQYEYLNALGIEVYKLPGSVQTSFVRGRVKRGQVYNPSPVSMQTSFVRGRVKRGQVYNPSPVSMQTSFVRGRVKRGQI